MSAKQNYFTVQEVADYLRVTRQTVYRWTMNGILPVQHIGRRGLIDSEYVKKIAEAREILGIIPRL